MTPTGTLVAGVTLQAGRYVIERPLGKGGMGRVYLARDAHVNNKLVAIKELVIDPGASTKDRAEAEAEFLAEMQTLASLSHPNIPDISDFFVERNGRFLVQEYVAGQDLEHAIRSVVVAPAPAPTATPVPAATATPVPAPTPSVGHELRRVNILPTTSATFTTDDYTIVDGDVRYPDFPVAAELPGDLTPPVTNLGRVAYSLHGGQAAEVPLGNGATTVQFSGPIPDSAVDREVQVPLSQHGCQGTCDAIQVYFFDGSTVLSTCVYQGEHFHAADLRASPNPPCLGAQ
jgi:hypothetical protein